METEEMALTRFMEGWSKNHSEMDGKLIPHSKCIELFNQRGGKTADSTEILQ